MGIEQRREARYEAKIAATLMSGRDATTLLSDDISFQGLFLRTDSPPMLRQLVSLELELPPEGRRFRAHAMAVHVVRVGNLEGRAAGVGLQFYALSGQESQVWHTFVRYVRDLKLSGKRLPTPAGHPDAIRREFPRVRAEFKLKFRTIDELYSACTRDVSRGGLFISTDRDIPVGSEISITLQHPVSETSLSAVAIVRRTSRIPRAKGLAVEFTGMSGARRDELFAFISDGIPSLDEVDLIEERDPRLC